MPRLPSVTQLISETVTDLDPSRRKLPSSFLALLASSTASPLPGPFIALPRIQQLPPSPSLRDGTASSEAATLMSSSSSIASTSPLLATDSGAKRQSSSNGYVYVNSAADIRAKSRMSLDDSTNRVSRSTDDLPGHLKPNRPMALSLHPAILPGGPLDSQPLGAGRPLKQYDSSQNSIPTQSDYAKENYRLGQPKKTSPPRSVYDQPVKQQQQPVPEQQQPHHLLMPRQHDQQVHTQQNQQYHNQQSQQLHNQQIQQQQHLQQHHLQQQHQQHQMHEYQRQQQQIQQQMHHQYQYRHFLHPSGQPHLQYGAPAHVLMTPGGSPLRVGTAEDEARQIIRQDQAIYQAGPPHYAMAPQPYQGLYTMASYAPQPNMYRPALDPEMNPATRMAMFPHATPQQAQMVMHNHSSMAPGGAAPTNRRVVKRRTRTGCFTCRQRRIKCDERKPSCMNCERSKKCCLGYDEGNEDRSNGQAKRKALTKNEQDRLAKKPAVTADVTPGNNSNSTLPQLPGKESRPDAATVKCESAESAKHRPSEEDIDPSPRKRKQLASVDEAGSQNLPRSTHHLESVPKRTAINDLLNDEGKRNTSALSVPPVAGITATEPPSVLGEAGRVSTVHKLIEQS